MEAVIKNYKTGRHVQTDNQMILVVKGVDNKEKAGELLGKKVVWKSSADKEIKGEVRAVHGNSGAVRVLFERGMPGQSVGSKVEIL